MNYLSSGLFIVMASLLFINCEGEKAAFIVDGNISGLDGEVIYLERQPFNSAIESLIQAEVSDAGDFSIEMDEHPGAGLYRLRMNGRSSLVVLDGSEERVSVSADAQTFSKNTYQVEGAPAYASYNDFSQKYLSKQANIGAIETFLKQTENPFSGLAFATKYLMTRPDFAPLHQSVLTRLQSEYPDLDHDRYEGYVKQMIQRQQMTQASDKIKVGNTAPEIEMPDPDGNMRKLSDLQGKVVLVDFWASWCGPCRRANPEVVKIYQKYKDRGFDIFSVSLDGLDQKSIKRFNLKGEELEKRMDSQRQRWLQAIEKDRLTWSNHVSELKKWDTPSIREYGVTGIPKTFLLDREGKIAAINPRFNLEEAILEVL